MIEIQDFIQRIEETEGPIVPADADIPDRVIAIVKLGLPDADAATYGGIPKRRLYKWLQRGKAYETALNTEGETPIETDEKYFKFYEKFEVAKVERKSRAVMTASLLARKKEDWKFFQWLLAKWDPETFGDKPIELQVKLSVEQGEMIAKVIKAVFDELGISDPRLPEVTRKHLALVAGDQT